MQYKRITANGQIVTGARRYLSGAILNPGSAVATLVIYDGTDNTGPRITGLVASANGVSAVAPELSLAVGTGIYVEITGTGADAYILFD
ncbi:MAG: hypothetical protein ABI947_00975 [Chloroflexota bacterium]